MEQQKYFVTDDTALAAYLYLKGMKFIEATLSNRNNRDRKKFIIFDHPERVTYESEFYARRSVVVPLEYHEAKVAVSRYLKVTVDDPRPASNKLVN